jgi:TorA maturation chaperone TorD
MTTESPLLAGSAAAGLLSSWWTEPTPQDLAVWREPTWWAEASVVWSSLGLAPGLPERLSATLAPPYEALLEEYQRLFVGPGAHPCPPYESVWRTDRSRLVQGTVMGPAAAAVRALYRGIGLRVRPDSAELPDHVAIELEALSAGLGPGGSSETARQLLEDHLAVWLPGFCERVAASSSHDFYRALASATPEWITGMLGLMTAAGDGRE